MRAALLRRPGRGPVAVRSAAYALGFLLLMTQGVGLSAADTVNGLALGALYGVVGVALVLVHRTTHVINFAAGALGAVPAITALLLVTQRGVDYAVALPIAAVGGFVVGGLTDLVLLRRFARAPRLILTVVTIGVAQCLAAIGFFVPVWFGATVTQVPKVVTPWGDLSYDNARGQPVVTGDQVFAFTVVLLLTAGLSLLLKRSRAGVALRAAADDADRASLLGIPVDRISTLAWALAGLLSALAVFTQAPLLGVPGDATLGFDTLLYGLAAAVVGRMERFGVTLAAGAGIGLVIFASVSRTGSSGVASALMLVVVLAALLLQRGARSRGREVGSATWQAVRAVRPVPAELRGLPEVVAGRGAILGLLALVAVGAPFVVPATQLGKLETLPLFGIVAVSLVVLTGWAGQISLGQFGLVGIGAAAAGGLVADHNIDFFVALLVGVTAGALTAVVVGLPAMRISGLYLAVTTLAFGYAMQGYVLNRNYWPGRLLLPDGPAAGLLRPVVYGRIDLEQPRLFYLAGLVLLGLSAAVALAFRRYHSGRVLLAVRDNPRAASSYGIDPVRTRLVAFAVSGGFAGLAGVLFAYQQHSVLPESFNVLSSVTVFLAACIGGLGSLWAAVLAVIGFQAIVLFAPAVYQPLLSDHPTLSSALPLLLTGPLLILTLYAYPGGLAQPCYVLRDALLRRAAARHGLSAHALVGERLPATARPEPAPDGAGEPLLRCRGVEVSYDRVQVLHGVDLDVAPGEIVALLGTNGAGKSTLLKAVSGLLDPGAGTIRFDGEDITHLGAVAGSRRGIVHVPGGRAVFPTLTVAEHVRLSSWGPREAGVADRTERVLELFPVLRERWDAEAGDLSGGEQQQLAIGMALIARPRLLLIDELSLGLAPAVVGRLLEVVREIAAGGASVLLVEQSVTVALTVAARAYFLEKGEVRFTGPTADLLDRPDVLRSVFLQGGPARTTEPPTPHGAPVLEVSGLTRSFGGVTALDDVDLTLHAGQILGLIGPNGAGKTTLLDVVSGHVPAQAGRVLLTGADVSAWPAHRRSALGLGRSFQDARLFPSLTVAECVALGLERHVDVRDPVSALFATPAVRASEDDVAYSVGDLLELLGLVGYRDALVSELSTGTRRIVDLAMSLAHDPVVLLLDEPSSGIAQAEAQVLGPLLQRVRVETGCAMLVVEHDMALVAGLADELVALDLGRVVVQGRPDEVLADPRVVTSYLGGDLAGPRAPAQVGQAE